MLDDYYHKGFRYYQERFLLFNIPLWSEFGKITTSRTITSLFIFTTAIPILLHLFPKNKEICVAFHKGTFCVPFELPFSATLLFIAGVCVTIATVIYAIRCPKWVKEFHTTRNFDEVKMSNMLLFEQADRYFDIEYGVDALPRFFLFSALCNHERTIAPLHEDFDAKYKSLQEAASKSAQFATNYDFVKSVVAKSVPGDPIFSGSLREQVQHDPERYFWKMFQLQDTGRRKSRILCAILIAIAYACLTLIFLQNVFFVAKHAM